MENLVNPETRPQGRKRGVGHAWVPHGHRGIPRKPYPLKYGQGHFLVPDPMVTRPVGVSAVYIAYRALGVIGGSRPLENDPGPLLIQSPIIKCPVRT